ncbi:unnamed protein product [Mytilus coruscus]|uniref:C-type lectin domain-containing protein n=1 Tax=Mytilus coruscus TaxID=42192 RepID=A0A6J8DZB6_MYTCO|nr:unnamed protein product [Mytilus coruscus]
MLTKLVLLSPRGSFTWMEAYDNCKANKGYLASEISYNSTVNLEEFSSAWVGKVELTSKWLQIMEWKWECDKVQTCMSIEPVCLCMSQLPTKYANAHSCDSANTYRFLVVYSRYLRSKSYENEIGNCMYSSCTTSPMQIDGPYVTECTSSRVRGVCELGESVNVKNIGWSESLNDCIEHYGTYFADDFRQVCSFVGSPSWTNIFRQNHSFYYTIPSNNDEVSHRIPLKCASIKLYIGYGVVNDKVLLPHYVACNTRLPYFLCETDSLQLVVSYSPSIMSTVANQNFDSSIIGGVVCGLIVLVVISIGLVIFKKRYCSIWKDENDTGERGSDHISVDEAGTLSGEQDHYQTSSYGDTDLSRTLKGRSDYFVSFHKAQDRKEKALESDDEEDLYNSGGFGTDDPDSLLVENKTAVLIPIENETAVLIPIENQTTPNVQQTGQNITDTLDSSNNNNFQHATLTMKNTSQMNYTQLLPAGCVIQGIIFNMYFGHNPQADKENDSSFSKQIKRKRKFVIESDSDDD